MKWWMLTAAACSTWLLIDDALAEAELRGYVHGLTDSWLVPTPPKRKWWSR